MSSASLRRSITASDPRSPLQLSSLVTSFPQHQIITSFQTFQVSPLRYSPRRTTPSPIYARPARALFHDDAAPEPSRLVKRRRSSSLAKLLTPHSSATASMAGVCACGGRRSVKHLVRDCPKFEAERERLISRDPENRSPLPRSTAEISAQQMQPPQGQQQNLVQIVRRRTRTLLGKVNIGDVQRDRDEKRPALTDVI
jgi:hypothetical protein